MRRFTRAIAGIIILSATLFFALLSVYRTGESEGRKMGNCETFCALIGVNFGFIDSDGDCWCKLGDSQYRLLPPEMKNELTN
jgi:hypothetical protein|tara:strand:+ start:16213 stop:16458 length:246 start_codon:yes stop_codon:yes gene_type:complete